MKKIISGILAGIICMSSLISLNSSAESEIIQNRIECGLLYFSLNDENCNASQTDLYICSRYEPYIYTNYPYKVSRNGSTIDAMHNKNGVYQYNPGGKTLYFWNLSHYELYCENYMKEIFVYINKDVYVVNFEDKTIFIDYSLTFDENTWEFKEKQSCGDINGDGYVTATDASIILLYAADCGAGLFDGSLEDYVS